MEIVHVVGWSIVKENLAMYSQLLYEGELDIGKEQWRVGRAFWS